MCASYEVIVYVLLNFIIGTLLNFINYNSFYTFKIE